MFGKGLQVAQMEVVSFVLGVVMISQERKEFGCFGRRQRESFLLGLIMGSIFKAHLPMVEGVGLSFCVSLDVFMGVRRRSTIRSFPESDSGSIPDTSIEVRVFER